MDIALIAPQAEHRSSPGGSADGQAAGQQVASLAEVLAELGNTVTIYAPRRPGQASRTALGVRVRLERLPVGQAGDRGAQIRALSEGLAERWRKAPPHVAHAQNWPAGLAALAGARGLGVPVVQTVPALSSPRRGGAAPLPSRRGGVLPKQALRLEVSLARNVNGVLATSSQTLQELAGYGVPRASMRLVPSGVDTDRFAPEGPVARRGRRPRLLTVAALRPDQGVDTVIRALAEVPEAELLIASPAGEDGERAALEKLGAELGVAERVRFVGELSSRELPAVLRSADLLVSAAWDEPFGTVALRAMACGTPVVASAVGCHQDSVIDGTTGMLIPPGQPVLLARRIRALLASPLRLEAFGIAAADRVRARYSWDRIGRETLSAYRNCIPHDDVEPEDLDEVA